MHLTSNQIKNMIPTTNFLVIDQFVGPLNETFIKYKINTKERVSAFLAQIFHESANLNALIENLNYSEKGLIATWPTRFNIKNAKDYARNQEKIGNKVYANRLGNGDEVSGDGFKYRGRGLIQVTGRANYIACGNELCIGLEEHPGLLTTPQYAVSSAGWYWREKELNILADLNTEEAFHKISRKINGGSLGKVERFKLYVRIKEVLG